jgi:hypothetical protein
MADDRLTADLETEIAYLRLSAAGLRADPEAMDMDRVATGFGRAVDALEAVLKLADGWDNSARNMLALAGEDATANAPTTAARSVIASVRQDSAREIRERITRALTGGTDGG